MLALAASTARRSGQLTNCALLLCVISLFSYSMVSYADGEALFQSQCSRCHGLDTSDTKRHGPSLDKIVGRETASLDNYEYSKALTLRGQNGMVWSVTNLDRFILSPSGLIPGTTMIFPGIAAAEDRDAIIDWLVKVADSGPVPATVSPVQQELDRILAVAGDPDYGEYLASECVTCHAGSGQSTGAVPSIDGLDTAYFLQALLEYKRDIRTSQVMNLMSQNLGDEELASLAAHFTR